MKKTILSLSILTTIASCANRPRTEIQADSKNIYSTRMNTHTGINTEMMDLNIRPQDNFYDFVNGNWMEKTQIPSDHGRWGSFNELRESNDSISLEILNSVFNQQFKAGSEEQKVADLYKTFMNVEARNQMGLAPIQNLLKKIQGLKNLTEFKAFLLEQTPLENNPLYAFYVSPHMKNSQQNAVYLKTPYLGMNRDYYQKTDEGSQSKIKAYQNYLVKLFSLIQDENPENSAALVVNLEKQIAQKLLSFENLRDSEKKYNPIAFSSLNEVNTTIDLADFFKALKIQTPEVIIPEITYYRSLGEIISSQNLKALKKYLIAQNLNSNANYLSTDLEELNFNFYSKELKGIDEMRARDKRALSLVNSILGEAFGKLYVTEVFPPEAKVKAEEMVKYIKKSFRQHIHQLTWMSDDTKVKALEKLDKFNVKIGYPDKWEDYSELKISNFSDGGSLYQNIQNAAQWSYQKDLKKIGKPVDKSKWFMPPQTVNAYYSPQFNEIVFPAAILQAPFYNFKADAAVNFGGMGAVIGHEISHGFDDSGAKYDGDGNLNNWWTPEDERKFNALGERLVQQFSAYQPFEGVFVNGKATLGENIADLGGLNVAYDALQLYYRDHKKPQQIDGFSPEQRFFISWATIWRTKNKDEALKNQIKTDFHAPGQYRAVGPLENMTTFHEVFNIESKDKMYKPENERIKIW